MKEKNNLLRIASILMIVCAVVAIVISAVNINSTMSGMANLGGAERAAIEAQLNENNMTMDQALTAVSGIAYAGLGFIAVFNVLKIVIGILGLRKADTGTKFFFVWGIVFLVFGVLSLSSGIFNLLGICNLLGGIVAPILFIAGSSQNKQKI